MQIVCPRAIVTKVFHSEKSGKDFLTIEEGNSTLNLNSGDLDLSKVPTLVPCKIEAEVLGFIFNKSMNLRVVSFKATPIS